MQKTSHRVTPDLLCVSALSVANMPCVSKTLGLSLSCQFSRCTAVRMSVSQSHALSEGTVAESSVKVLVVVVDLVANVSQTLQLLFK